jgi:hypothetical protein
MKSSGFTPWPGLHVGAILVPVMIIATLRRWGDLWRFPFTKFLLRESCAIAPSTNTG